MKYLVDANVLSEPTKPLPDAQVVDWLSENEAELAISAIVLGELEYGILLLPASRRRTRLQQWFLRGVQRLRVIEFDADSAAAWARLLAGLKKKNISMPIKDSLIAATALVHDLTVVTRNVTDFRHAGVTLLNPFND